MKLSRYVWLFWLGNLVILVGFGAFLWNENGQTRAQRDARNAAIANLTSTEPRIPWQNDTTPATFTVVDTMLSPRERPKPEPVVDKPGPRPEPVTKSDEQLKSELEAELNRKFTLLRLALSSTDEYPTIAMVVSGSTRLQWFEGMNLKEEYGAASSSDLRRLAYDLKILCIDEYGVLVNAASFEKPEKRFDVRIKMFEGQKTNNMMSTEFPREGGALKLAPYYEEQPERKESKPDARNWPDELPQAVPEEDYDKQVVDDFAEYTKSTEHGLQILPELPEESPARKYGARGGEIIKSINGESVKSMSDVRRVVRSQYDAGTREFKVGFERDGIPGERTFTAPK